MALPPLQPFAGVGVTNTRRKEAEAEGQHEDIPHEKLLAARVYLRAAFTCFREGMDGSIGTEYDPDPPGSVG